MVFPILFYLQTQRYNLKKNLVYEETQQMDYKQISS